MVNRSSVMVAAMLVALTGCGGGGSSSPPPSPSPSPAPAPTPPPAPAPAITQLTPNETTAGGTNFVLTVTGTGFVANSVIRWNGVDKTTTFVNATNLQTPITAGDIATAGTLPVLVVNPAASGGNSNSTTFTINNPAPAITTLSPASTIPGGPQFTLTVDGSGFVNASVVRWNGSNRTTTFVSASRVTATINAADIATQSQSQITVVNAAPGGGTSNAVTLAVGNPLPVITQFQPSVVRPGGAAFDLTINGTAFVTGASVTWNGAPLTTTFVSSTQLTAAVSAGDIAAAGIARIIASNPAPGGGASNAAVLSIAPVGVTERVSVANDGSQANDRSDSPSASATARYVAFTSWATNLVANDTNGFADVFVRDTCAGVASGCTPSTQRVSVASDGSAGNEASDNASISANGRYIAFVSKASNLVAGDTNGVQDVFVRDTCVSAAGGCTPSTFRVSVATDGSQANFESTVPSISGNGRYVGFITDTILVLGDLNNAPDAFVRDTCAGAAGCTPTTARVSMVNDGNPDDRGTRTVSLSADGRFIAYTPLLQCSTCNLRRSTVQVFDSCNGAAAGCTPSARQVTQLEVLSVSDRALSSDGRYVTFNYYDTAGGYQAYLGDSCVGAPAGCAPSRRPLTSRLSNFPEIRPTITPGGRFLSYAQPATPASALSAVFANDTCLGGPADCLAAEVRVSESSSGVAADRLAYAPSLSSEGDLVAFASDATTLIANDTNDRRDIFIAKSGLEY